MKNLDILNVKELNIEEQRKTEGGLWGIFATFFVIGLLYGLLSN